MTVLVITKHHEQGCGSQSDTAMQFFTRFNMRSFYQGGIVWKYKNIFTILINWEANNMEKKLMTKADLNKIVNDDKTKNMNTEVHSVLHKWVSTTSTYVYF